MSRPPLRILISFLGAFAAAQVAAGATPPGAVPGPVPSTSVPAPRAQVGLSGDDVTAEYLRNASVRLGVSGPTSLQSLDILCPTRNLGSSASPFELRFRCW